MTNALAIVTADLDFDTTIDSTARLCDEALLMMQQYESHIYQASIVLGAKLQEVKARLPHGAFMPWLETANWEGRTAQRLMMIAKELGPISDTVSHIPRNMLYTIAKLPADKRDNVLILITDPEHPPLNEIKTRVKEISDAEAVAKYHRKIALNKRRNENKFGKPSDRALTMRANADAKFKAEYKARFARMDALTAKLAEILSNLDAEIIAQILDANANAGLIDYDTSECFGRAFEKITSTPVEPMPTPKQLDHSDDIAVEVPELDMTAA